MTSSRPSLTPPPAIDHAGATWQVQNSGTQRGLSSVFATDARTVWVGGAAGLVLSSATGGK